MSMLLCVGNCTCDEATIDKSGAVVFGTAKNCDPYEDMAFDNQVAVITDYNAGDEAFNYASMQDDNEGARLKYYYIRNRMLTPGGRIVYILECDPLYTYKDDIYALDCVCRRTGNDSSDSNLQDAYIRDPYRVARAYKSVDYYAAEKPILGNVGLALDQTHMIIITVG